MSMYVCMYVVCVYMHLHVCGDEREEGRRRQGEKLIPHLEKQEREPHDLSANLSSTGSVQTSVH